MGHRGCRHIGNIPENSISAFTYAVNQGIQGIELDVRLTKDGHIVVFHDSTFSRLCVPAPGSSFPSGATSIAELTLAEVKHLRFKNWNSTETIPTLEEFMQWMEAVRTQQQQSGIAQENCLKTFIEIKALAYLDGKIVAKAVTENILQHNAVSWACIISFSPIAVYFSRVYAPTIEVCFLYCYDLYIDTLTSPAETPEPWMFIFAHLLDWCIWNFATTLIPSFTGCTMVGPDQNTMSNTLLQSIHDKGLDVYLWVINTPSLFDFFIHRQCSVGTDYVFPIPVPFSSLSDEQSTRVLSIKPCQTTKQIILSQNQTSTIADLPFHLTDPVVNKHNDVSIPVIVQDVAIRTNAIPLENSPLPIPVIDHFQPVESNGSFPPVIATAAK